MEPPTKVTNKMKTPEIPANEESRLASLNALGLLDSPPEERFDRITRLAKGTFDVPIALVSLIDENRQWFKSCFGLSVRQTDRDISFCGHAILGNDVFVITDALQTPAFADNPLVTHAPFIRFYAGCPLKSPDGRTIGTLCMIDQKPREFGERQKQKLRKFASMIEQELTGIRQQTIDDDTGLSNKQGLIQLADYTRTVCLKAQTPISLSTLTICLSSRLAKSNHRKAINLFVQVLMKHVRDLDVFARINDESFALLLANCTADEAEILIETYWTDIETELAQRGLPDAMTMKFDATELPSDDQNAHAMLEAL